MLVSFCFATLSFNRNPAFLVFSLQQSAEEMKAIKEIVLAFLEERHHREVAKAAADGDGSSLATSPSSACESSAGGGLPLPTLRMG